ncbi:14459_t:CDS:10 [Acaulospora morrowiae]|uniref:14459_t:CDS:1 n=1 Tax=Acaulospora morrowiae TaxID=94023 RepID=A0A9N9AMI7_9GLOM|nr:14459_t:CDS:10 [Acaulospora morrowiae]
MLRSTLRSNIFATKLKYLVNSNRWYTSSSCHYGMCIDIDGVLIKGNNVVPEAKRALQFLNGDNLLNKKIPFILLTNGGGETEESKAEKMSEKLDFLIKPSQIVLSHSPMEKLVPKYRDSEILVIGGKRDECRIAAENYGFKRVVIPNDILVWNPSIWPFSNFREEDLKWARIALDVLRSKDGYIGTIASQRDLLNHQIPLFFSNPDIMWSTEFPNPRFAQGSFRIALECLFEKYTGLKLKSEWFGKPETVTYEYAHMMLENYAYELTGDSLPNRKIYAVGDNPASDIAGANRHGWHSILVKTGVFQGEGNDLKDPADHVTDNVLGAVKWMFANEEGH